MNRRESDRTFLKTNVDAGMIMMRSSYHHDRQGDSSQHEKLQFNTHAVKVNVYSGVLYY